MNPLIVNIRKLAITHKLSDGMDVYVDNAYKYYSKTYNTALQSAYDIPEEIVLLIFMQDEMEALSKEELLDWKEELRDKSNDLMLEMPKRTNPKKQLSAMDDEAWIAEMNLKLQKEAEANKVKQMEAAAKAVKQIDNAIGEIEKKINSTFNAVQEKK